MVAVELRERTCNLQLEFSQDGSRRRGRFLEGESGRFHEALPLWVQPELVAVHRQARDYQERLVRELRDRGAYYRADSLQKQQAIENVTDALSTALAKLSAQSAPVAAGGAPPSPSGWRRRPRWRRGWTSREAEEGPG